MCIAFPHSDTHYDGTLVSGLCPYCCGEYAVPSQSILLSYIRMVHLSDPNFMIQCPADSCCRTFTNFRIFQNHCLTHPTVHHNRVNIITDDIDVEDHSDIMDFAEFQDSYTNQVGIGKGDQSVATIPMIKPPVSLPSVSVSMVIEDK